MSQGLEADAAEAWMHTLLAGDTTLKGLGFADTYFGPVPEGVAYPFIHAQMMAGTDLMVVGAARVWANLVYLIEVVAQTESYGVVQTAYARMDALLHKGNGTDSLGTVVGCVREQPYRKAESLNGVPYRRLGGIYRLYAQG